MARRYIGKVTLYLRVVDDESPEYYYKLRAYAGVGRKGYTLEFTLGPPKSGWDIACDPPEAFDRIALSASSFLMFPDGGEPSKEVAADFEEALSSGMKEDGTYLVRRTKEEK